MKQTTSDWFVRWGGMFVYMAVASVVVLFSWATPGYANRTPETYGCYYGSDCCSGTCDPYFASRGTRRVAGETGFD